MIINLIRVSESKVMIIVEINAGISVNFVGPRVCGISLLSNLTFE